MTVEQDKEQVRRTALMALWSDRHPDEEMNSLDACIMECLILLGEEYDKNFKDKTKEKMLYTLSVKMRDYLGIAIKTKDKSVKSPTNENKIN